MSYNSLTDVARDAALVGKHDLQETTGIVAYDSSGNANHGVIGGFGANPAVAAGPTSWLPSSFDFPGGGADEEVVSIADMSGLASYSHSIVMWLYCQGAGGGNQGRAYDSPGGAVAALVNSSNEIKCSIKTPTEYGGYTYRTPDNTWQQWVVFRGGSQPNLKVYRNGSYKKQSTAYGTPPVTSLTIGNDAATGGTRSWNGRIAGFLSYSKVLTTDERAELYAGPEPTNTVNPTLSIDSSSWTGTLGSWDGQSNVTTSISYQWELRDADDDSVVESGSGSPSGSGSYSGDYYLWVRASNDGGYDDGADSVSPDETASGGGGITGTASITLDDATIGSTGAVTLVGQGSPTADDATMDSASTLSITGAVSTTTADATLSSAATTSISGSVSVTTDDATLVSTAGGGIAGSLDVTLDDATTSSAGQIDIDGTAAGTTDDATLSATGQIALVAAANMTTDDATLSSTAGSGVGGSVNVTTNDATLSSTATTDISGGVNITLDDAVSNAVGDLAITAAANMTTDDATLIANNLSGSLISSYYHYLGQGV